MRWDDLSETPGDEKPGTTRALFGASAVTRTFETPGFRGMTFHEVRARSLINKVPGASRMPFEWTVNPYRGCSHACVYCFARRTHSYLDLDTGEGFDSQIVVKVNAPELLRKELSAPRWRGQHIAMGTNVDCYQRAEGRYGLMRGVLTALRDHANPFSVLTKGTLILRDLDLLRSAVARRRRTTTTSTAEATIAIGSQRGKRTLSRGPLFARAVPAVAQHRWAPRVHNCCRSLWVWVCRRSRQTCAACSGGRGCGALGHSSSSEVSGTGEAGLAGGAALPN